MDTFNFNIGIDPKDVEKMQIERHHHLFCTGDRVRIARGLFVEMDEQSVRYPMDVSNDLSIGLFGVIVNLHNFDNIESEDFDEHDMCILFIQLEPNQLPERSHFDEQTRDS